MATTKMRGGKDLILDIGRIPFEFRIQKASTEAVSGLKMLNMKTGNLVGYKKVDKISGEEVFQTVSGKEVGDRMVVLTDEELDGAFADREKEIRNVVVEDNATIQADRIKSYYNAVPVNETYWNMIGGRMVAKKKQIRFNLVEGRQSREAIMKIENGKPCIYVLYFPSELKEKMNIPEPVCDTKFADKVDALFDKLAQNKLEVAENVRDKVIDGLVARKLSGVEIEMPVVVKGAKKIEQTAEELLAASI